MNVQKDELIEAVNESVKDLQERIDKHCCLVSAIVKNRGDTEDLPGLTDFYPPGDRERKLKQAIAEAINVLEETRSSFKSKQLEMLRKRLTRLLADIG
ncbi:MAG: hypothetical protein R6X08_08895 [Desulfosalsimonadaceae bacterium]